MRKKATEKTNSICYHSQIDKNCKKIDSRMAEHLQPWTVAFLNGFSLSKYGFMGLYLWQWGYNDNVVD
jgi:hypothetical protein